jgi:hypothetical protein
MRKLAAKLCSQQVNEIQSQVKKEHNPSTGCVNVFGIETAAEVQNQLQILILN